MENSAITGQDIDLATTAGRVVLELNEEKTKAKKNSLRGGGKKKGREELPTLKNAFSVVGFVMENLASIPPPRPRGADAEAANRCHNKSTARVRQVYRCYKIRVVTRRLVLSTKTKSLSVVRTHTCLNTTYC